MNKTAKKLLLSVFVVLMVFTCVLLCGKFDVDMKLVDVNITTTVLAATEGYYTYEVSDGKATITKVSKEISGKVTIPTTLGRYKVVSIDSGAFSGCTSITNITIPDGVTSISWGAFSGCTSLTKITLPFVGESPNARHTHFGYIFGVYDIYSPMDDYIPSSLKEVIITAPCEKIGDRAFFHCDSLKSITLPNSVTLIDNTAFAGCTSLTNINIPNSVTSIGMGAFIGCDNLKSIIIPESVISIGNSAFTGCDSLANISIANGVTSIGLGAFENCTSLKSITIPESVTLIGYGALEGCTSLTKITLPFVGAAQNGTSNIHFSYIFGDAVYSSNDNVPEKLKEVIITAPCVRIGNNAFQNCYSITNITIPDSVISIGEDAFSGTAYYNNLSNWTNRVLYIDNHLIKALTSITSYDIKQGTKTIAASAFKDCSSLTNISIPEGVSSIGSYAFSGCDSLKSITIPKGVISIGDRAFSFCDSLKTIIISKGVTLIGNGAFYGCDSLTNIIIPSGVTSIGDSAFEYCNNLTGITIPVSLTSIGANVFYRCRNFKYVFYGGTEEQKKKISISMDGNDKLIFDAIWHFNAKGHSYTAKTTKATLTANGSVNSVCTVCDYVKTDKTISYPKTFTLSTTSYPYNGSVKTPTVTVKDAAGKVLKKDTDYTVIYASGRKNVGTYNVTVKMKGNYTGTKTLSFKITPINISNCTVKLSATSVTYNGAVRTPTVTVRNANGVKLTKDTHYTVTYDEGRKNAGTYNVTVKMKGNYTGTKTLSFKITPINISNCTVKLSATSVTYNGAVRTPTVTVKNANGVKLTKDTHYTVTYASGRKNAGTYNVTVKMKGNYTGTKTLSFKINPKNISTCNIKLSATSYTYDGKVKAPTVTVTNAYGTKLTKGTHYTVTYQTGRKNVGTYKVAIKMIGNYTGTKTLTFKINPPKTTVSSLTAGTKKITVNLTKKTTQVTGYQIQYATNKDFINAKTKTITSNSTVKTTLSSLTSGKTYYVRVRTYKTVNDVKYYSGWSAYKYVKTK